MQALFRFADAVDLNMTEPELKFSFSVSTFTSQKLQIA